MHLLLLMIYSGDNGGLCFCDCFSLYSKLLNPLYQGIFLFIIIIIFLILNLEDTPSF
jgi:hypothetical protein